MTTSHTVTSRSASETRRLGACLATLLKPGDVVLLRGPFGAGKTTLVQGIAAGLGVTGRVTSPSFALVNEYRADEQHGRMPIYHIDVYRVASSEEALGFGLEEYLGESGLSLIEWAERIEDVLPEDHLRITLAVSGASRRTLTLTALGHHYEEVVAAFARECGVAE